MQVNTLRLLHAKHAVTPIRPSAPSASITMSSETKAMDAELAREQDFILEPVAALMQSPPCLSVRASHVPLPKWSSTMPCDCWAMQLPKYLRLGESGC